jgi:hypothetical protein
MHYFLVPNSILGFTESSSMSHYDSGAGRLDTFPRVSVLDMVVIAPMLRVKPSAAGYRLGVP